MATRWTQTLIPTARQIPAEAEVPSHQLMLRAGLIRKLGSGVYDYLPLGLRSLQKAMSIIREEMETAGAVELLMPTLIPLELFRSTGRDVAYGDNLFRFKDRHGREQALGPTHEEVVTEIVGAHIESYKQLPLTLYQIQTKFRDEFRPRFGVLRSREFQMKDAYSFHTSVDGPGGLNEVYEKQYAAYERIFKRCGLPYRVVEAESGPIGGSASHEFMVPSPTGEDTILESDKGNYAANVEKAEIGRRSVSASLMSSIAGDQFVSTPAAPPSGDLEKIHTPNCATIEDVGKFLKVKAKNMLKTLLRIAAVGDTSNLEEFSRKVANGEGRITPPRTPSDLAPSTSLQWWVVCCVVRGDHELNEGKIQQHINRESGQRVTLWDTRSLFESLNFPVGFVGPQLAVSNSFTQLVIDPDAAVDQFWATGGNEVDYHVKHFHWKRDVLDPLGEDSWRMKIADIRNAVAGDPSPRNDGGVLKTTKGIEIGHVFKLGDKYTRAMNVTTLLPDNTRIHLIMGCYGIGVNRILASAIEREGGNDENGIVWPSSIAPFQICITPIRYEGQAKEVAERIAAQLAHERSPTQPRAFFHPDVVIDDRDERPGVKFKDADLIGFPVRITLGEKTLANGQVEIKARTQPKAELVPIDQAAKRALELLATL